jgi:hypothetical protein
VPVNLCRHRPTIPYLGDDGTALGPVLDIGAVSEGRAVLLPVPEVVRGGHEQTTRLAVECRIEADIATIRRLDDPRVFASTRPFPRLPDVGVPEEHRFGLDREVDPVVTDGEPDSRRPAVGANRILAPKQQADLAVAHHGGRIENVFDGPGQRRPNDRALELCVRLAVQDLARPAEWPDLPVAPTHPRA